MFDVSSPEVIRDPYTWYGRLRDEDPVQWNELSKAWLVTGHAELTSVVRRHDVFSSRNPRYIVSDPSQVHPPIDEADWDLARWFGETYRPFAFQDRPAHLLMRQAVHGWFRPKAIEAWRAKIREMVEDLLDSRLADGGMEVKEDLALPFPLTTISWMLGIPLGDSRHLSDLVATFVSQPGSPRRFRARAEAWHELQEYFDPLIEQRAKQPADDLISMLAVAEQEGAYTRDSCIATITNLVQAGHETTLGLITSGLLAFIRNPGQWDLLRSDPDGLCVSAVEECLRYEPALKQISRHTIEDADIAGKRIRSGDMVFLTPPSANRDPRVFADPETFDITRSPNPHVAFGGGIHFCLGASLARVEAQEALRGLATRFRRLRLESDDVEWLPSTGVRQLVSLPVTWS
jgi:pimeloyl-[acyl-carrier protein] synthase